MGYVHSRLSPLLRLPWVHREPLPCVFGQLFPLSGPHVLRGLQVCNALESEGYSWDSGLLCDGTWREVPLGATEPITSDYPLHHESQSLHACAWVFAKTYEILCCMHCYPSDHQIRERDHLRGSFTSSRHSPAAAQGNISICAAGRMGCSSIFCGLGHPS